MRGRALICCAAVMACAIGCRREARRYSDGGQTSTQADAVRLTPLQPGAADGPQRTRSPYQDNAYGISEGKRLYSAFNCNGCHAAGGGAIGPALMDSRWIYGSEPDQIFSSIVQGRPDGMPSFSGRVPEQQVWQIVAYVQSLSAQTPRDAASGRNDDMSVAEPDTRLDRLTPKQTGHR